jgi:DNA-binding XRE family transcriptional regulator
MMARTTILNVRKSVVNDFDKNGLFSYTGCGMFLKTKEGLVTGKKLKCIRRGLGLTQTGLAMLFGRSRQTIGEWERGKFDVDPLVARIMLAIDKRKELVNELFPEYARMHHRPYPERMEASFDDPENLLCP